MPISYDNSIAVGFQPPGSTTYSPGNIVIGATASYILVGFAGNGSNAPTAVDIGGSAMTQLGSNLTTSFTVVSYWYLVSPLTGSRAVNLTFSSALADAAAVVAASYIGVDTAAPHGTPVTKTEAATTGTISLTAASGEVGVAVHGAHDCTLSSATQTSRGTASNPNTDIGVGLSEAAGTGSAVSYAWTASAAVDFCEIAVALKPTSTGAVTGTASLGLTATGTLTGRTAPDVSLNAAKRFIRRIAGLRGGTSMGLDIREWW